MPLPEPSIPEVLETVTFKDTEPIFIICPDATGVLYCIQRFPLNEVANLSNIEFTADAPIGTSGNVPLYAWIESGASSSATNTVAWVNLASNTLGAAGSGTNTLTIYMNFLPNNSPVTSGYTGYAPQLYCASGCFQTSYAQYDDGGSVFNFYDNFAGTTLNTNKWSSTIGSGGSITVNNGITISETDKSNIQSFIQSVNQYSNNQFIEFYTNSITLPSGNWGWIGSFTGTPTSTNWGVTSGLGYAIEMISPPNPSYNIMYSNLGQTAGGSSSLNSQILSVIWLSNDNSIIFSNYNNAYDLTYSSYSPSSNIGLFAGINNAGTSSFTVMWFRTRSYPPNGVMPSASFGSII